MKERKKKTHTNGSGWIKRLLVNTSEIDGCQKESVVRNVFGDVVVKYLLLQVGCKKKKKNPKKKKFLLLFEFVSEFFI